MRRTLIIVAIGLLVAASACSSSKSSTATTSPTSLTSGGSTAPGGATTTAPNQTRTVQVDGKSDKFNSAFLAYFPNAVTVRPGDTVQFHENWTGEPHTVTLGTLVETGLAAARTAGRNAAPPAAFASLPVLIPQGPGDAHQNAAQPCYLPTGTPPSNPATPCPQTAQPDFDGTQNYYNSGWLAPDQTWSMKIGASAKPGTYHYYCNLHGPQMSGTITIMPAATAIPTQGAVDQAGTSELNALVNGLLPAAQQARQGTFGLPGVTHAAGWGSPQVMTGSINEFLPTSISAKVGQKVTWTFLGPHTISFKSPYKSGQFISRSADGSVHLNQAMLAPVGGPGVSAPPQSNASSNGPPTLAPPTDGGSYDGSGPRSTGFVVSFPPVLSQFSLTFTKAGTYSYTCLIHPGMDGVVTVS